MDVAALITDLQSQGLRVDSAVERRTGGAGPSDSGLIWIEGVAATVPTGTAWAEASLLTVTRTSSLPARASATTCRAVSTTSAVSVFVIDWTTTGCAEPRGTPPMRAVTVGRRRMAGIREI